MFSQKMNDFNIEFLSKYIVDIEDSVEELIDFLIRLLMLSLKQKREINLQKSIDEFSNQVSSK